MNTRRPVRKAVIPVAGLGTRFLPATKAIPKEMLPVVDKPAIQYVMEEAVRAGVENVVMVTGRNKGALEDHFDRHWELERALEKKGDDLRLRRVQKSNEMGAPHFVRQGEPKGLGHAVLCGRPHVGDEPFAVLLGDDLIGAQDHLLEQMIAVQSARGGSVVALMEVPADQVNLYGCAATEGEPDADGVVRITGVVEKPDPADAPSNLAIIGRYVLDPSIFDVLEETPRGAGGEIQLTDALMTLASQEPLRGVVFRGVRHDVGDKLGFLKATVHLALERDDLGPDFRAWLHDVVADQSAAAAPEGNDA